MAHKCTISVTMTDGLFCNGCRFEIAKSGRHRCVLHDCDLTEYSKGCVAKCASCGSAKVSTEVVYKVDTAKVAKAADILVASYISAYKDLRKQGFAEEVALKIAKEMCKS